MKNERIVLLLWISTIWLLAALILTDLTVRSFGGISYLWGVFGFFIGEMMIHDIVFDRPKKMLILYRSVFSDLKEKYNDRMNGNLSFENFLKKSATDLINTLADVKNIYEANRDFVQWRIKVMEKLICSDLPIFSNIKTYSKFLKTNGRLLAIKAKIRDLEEESNSVKIFLLGKDNPY